jgi:hypothetical protein
MKLLKQEQEVRSKIFKYFGYVEDWRVLPLNDCTSYYWYLDQEGNGHGTVNFASSPEDFTNEVGEYYQDEIYTQRHLPKWVYRGEEYTMIVVDTHTDGNQFLSIFDNSKEVR